MLCRNYILTYGLINELFYFLLGAINYTIQQFLFYNLKLLENPAKSIGSRILQLLVSQDCLEYSRKIIH